MPHYGSPEVAILTMFIRLIVIVIWVACWKSIFRKAWYKRYILMARGMVLPILNIIMLFKFAYGDWPRDNEW